MEWKVLVAQGKVASEGVLPGYREQRNSSGLDERTSSVPT